MWLCDFKNRFVFFWIESFILWIYGWWNGLEKIFGEYIDNFGVYRFGDDLFVVGNIVK